MTTLERVTALLPEGTWTELPSRDGVLTLEVQADGLAQAFPRLTPEAGFETITLVTALDHMDGDGQVRGPRFEVCYQFLSLAHSDRVRFTVRVEADQPHAPSATHCFPAASFLERECFDMFGIRFDGNADMRRLLMPEAFEHHPLRKDFPHQGIEPDKLYRRWNAQRGGAQS